MTFAIFGGSFDPVHLGHIAAAKSVLEQAADLVFLVPSALNPHKDSLPAGSPEQRLKMLELAIEGIPGIQIWAGEVQRPAPSYTIDTLRELSRLRPGEEAALVVGPDLLPRLNEWRDFPELCRKVLWLILQNRPGVEFQIPPSLGRTPGFRYRLIDNPEFEVSSSGIRNRLRRGEDCEGHLPQAVSRYIHEQKIYPA